MPHPVHPPYAEQRLPLECSGPPVHRAHCDHAGPASPSRSPSGHRVLLRPHRGLVPRCGFGAGLPSGLRHTSDTQTAALEKTQELGDVAAFTARGFAPVA